MANDKYNGTTGVEVIQGITYPRSNTANIDTKVVEVVHVSDTTTGKVYAKTLFDFSETPEESILEMAAKSAVISCRATEFKADNLDNAIENDGMTLNPMDYFKRERKRGPETTESLITKLKKKGLTNDEIIEMLKS